MSNIALFLDVHNLYHAAKSTGSTLNYSDLIGAMVKDHTLVAAHAYLAQRTNDQLPKVIFPLGVELHTKRVLIKQDVEKQRVIPPQFHTEITADVLITVLDEAKDVETVILATGDGQFSYLVEVLLDYKINVEIWSYKHSVSRCLLKGTRFVEIAPKTELIPDYTYRT